MSDEYDDDDEDENDDDDENTEDVEGFLTLFLSLNYLVTKVYLLIKVKRSDSL